jgi:hypothetical protein
MTKHLTALLAPDNTLSIFGVHMQNHEANFKIPVNLNFPSQFNLGIE